VEFRWGIALSSSTLVAAQCVGRLFHTPRYLLQKRLGSLDIGNILKRAIVEDPPSRLLRGISRRLRAGYLACIWGISIRTKPSLQALFPTLRSRPMSVAQTSANRNLRKIPSEGFLGLPCPLLPPSPFPLLRFFTFWFRCWGICFDGVWK